MINSLSDFDCILGEGWHWRVCNEERDFAHIEPGTLKYWMSKRRPLEEYTSEGFKQLLHRGYRFHLQFVHCTKNSDLTVILILWYFGIPWHNQGVIPSLYITSVLFMPFPTMLMNKKASLILLKLMFLIFSYSVWLRTLMGIWQTKMFKTYSHKYQISQDWVSLNFLKPLKPKLDRLWKAFKQQKGSKVDNS